MKIRTLFSLLCGAGLLFTANLSADDEAPRRPQRPRMEMGGPGGPGGPGGQRGGMMGVRNPMMGIAFQVKPELDAYNADKSDANYAKLEAAVKAASAKRKADLEKRLEQLKNDLANFDQNQEKQNAEFLAKVKSGEFKMPERPKRGSRQPGKQPAIPGTGSDR